jgi:hypothetical protein
LPDSLVLYVVDPDRWRLYNFAAIELFAEEPEASNFIHSRTGGGFIHGKKEEREIEGEV